jgi:hypothetical protein
METFDEQKVMEKIPASGQSTSDYAGAALKKNWPRLHRGDGEPYPKAMEASGGLARLPCRRLCQGASRAA